MYPRMHVCMTLRILRVRTNVSVCVHPRGLAAGQNHYELFTQTPRPKTLPSPKLAVKFTSPTDSSKGNRLQILAGAEPKIAATLPC